MKMFEVGQELLIGFIRDQEDEDEFYLQVKSKMKNDSFKIAVDDIDEIEHVEGTLKFYIHYQRKASQSVIDGVQADPKKNKSSIGSMFKKKLLGGNNDDEEEAKEECSELFESKFVKSIIEAFNIVIELVEEQENELNDWVGDDIP